MTTLLRKLNWLARRREKETELTAELQFHLDEEADQHRAAGMTTEDAHLAARRDFGNVTLAREDARAVWIPVWLEQIVQDIRYGLRVLRENPGFTAVAVATLALGIGINAAGFTVANAILFKGFPFVADNDRLVYLSNPFLCCLPYADFEDYRAQAKSFDGMAIVHGVGLMLNDNTGSSEYLDATEVSADTFRLVQQRPIIGRDFTASDEIPGSNAVAVLSYGLWERRYGKDPAILQRTARLNGVTTSFIGVMPRGFSFPQKADVWVPLVATPAVRARTNTATWFAFGHLAPSATFDSARVEIESIAKRLSVIYPVTNRDFRPAVLHFHQFFIGANAALLYGSMWGAVSFVLLIACANLANLLLARSMSRSREIAIRIALGAGRWRIIRQLLLESLLLSSLGGLFGWWIAQAAIHFYRLAMEDKARWLILDYSMDSRVLLYLIAISMGTGLLFGLAPALALAKSDLNASLKDGGRSATGGGRGKRLSGLLVTVEMTLAVVLLAGSGVMVRSFLIVHNASIGVNAANMLSASVNLPASRYPTTDAQTSFFDRLTSKMKTVPGITSVALAQSIPQYGPPPVAFEIDGIEQREASRPRNMVLTVGPNYFHTLEAQLLAGRDFTDLDDATAPPVAIVSQRFVNKMWPHGQVVGKRVRLFKGNTPGPWLSVVGVASDIVQHDETRQQFDPVIYVPYRQHPLRAMFVLVRTSGPPANFVSAYRRQVQDLDPDLPMFGPAVLEHALEEYSETKFYGLLFLTFAGIALLLASVGLYGVIAHSVNQRTQEIGIRMALGATASQVRKLVFVKALLPLGVGLGVGLAASFAVNRILKFLLVQISPADPVSLFAACGVLILAAALGCLIPARRATQVNPLVALRHD